MIRKAALLFLMPALAGAGPLRVVVIGIDGATWAAIDPLIDRGLLPSFAALRRHGVTGPLISLPPYNSPQMWTTIATGLPPSVHGIMSFTAKGPRGRRIPASSNLRKVPAAWNIVSDFGRTVGTVSWYVTWPAEKVNGYIVSDHVRPARESAIFWPVSAEEEAHLGRRTWPDGLVKRMKPFFCREEDVSRPVMKRDLHLFGDKHPFLQDETTMRMAIDLLRLGTPDLLMLYQHGTDVMQHLSYGPFQRWLDGGELARGSKRVIDYYEYVDSNLARIVRAVGGSSCDGEIALPTDMLLIVVSDHGFGPGKRPRQPILTGDHRPAGILAMLGAGVRRGHLVQGATVLDILPTILRAMGLPLLRGFPGRPLMAAFRPGVVPRPRFVDAYRFRSEGGKARSSPLDKRILEELEAMGYIDHAPERE